MGSNGSSWSGGLYRPVGIAQGSSLRPVAGGTASLWLSLWVLRLAQEGSLGEVLPTACSVVGTC